MKRLVSILIAISLMITGVFAAAVPEFLTKQYNNYTADYTVSLSFDNSKEVINLLKELEIPDTINTYVDLEALLESLLAYEETIKLQADISSNYEKIKIGITAEAKQNINVNKNLNVAYNMKAGMWMNIDLSNENEPVFDIIYSHPLMNKYLKISASDIMEQQSMDMIKSIYNKEFIESISKTSMELFAKYATIKGSGTRYTVTMDNDGMTSYLDEIIALVSDVMVSEDTTYNPYAIVPSLKGLQILGKDGIETVYSLKGKNIASAKVTADISVDIAQIYTLISGFEWPYESSGKLDFTLEAKTDVSRIGTTKVSFPTLTDENTVLLEDIMPSYNYDDYEPEPLYPKSYIYGYEAYLPIVDGMAYVPLRSILEKAYRDSVTISYDNGVITAESEYFTEFDKVVITVGSDTVYADDKEYTGYATIVENGTTYINPYFFRDVFGWTGSIEYNFMNREFIFNYFAH